MVFVWAGGRLGATEPPGFPGSPPPPCGRSTLAGQLGEGGGMAKNTAPGPNTDIDLLIFFSSFLRAGEGSWWP